MLDLSVRPSVNHLECSNALRVPEPGEKCGWKCVRPSCVTGMLQNDGKI